VFTCDVLAFLYTPRPFLSPHSPAYYAHACGRNGGLCVLVGLHAKAPADVHLFGRGYDVLRVYGVPGTVIARVSAMISSGWGWRSVLIIGNYGLAGRPDEALTRGDCCIWVGAGLHSDGVWEMVDELHVCGPVASSCGCPNAGLSLQLRGPLCGCSCVNSQHSACNDCLRTWIPVGMPT
jgi:hypothetical protein